MIFTRILRKNASSRLSAAHGGSFAFSGCCANIRCAKSYFLTDEKVCKESPRTFRMVLGLSRRPKGEADGIIFCQQLFRFPLGNPLDSLCLNKFLCRSGLPRRQSRLAMTRSYGTLSIVHCPLSIVHYPLSIVHYPLSIKKGVPQHFATRPLLYSSMVSWPSICRRSLYRSLK